MGVAVHGQPACRHKYPGKSATSGNRLRPYGVRHNTYVPLRRWGYLGLVWGAGQKQHKQGLLGGLGGRVFVASTIGTPCPWPAGPAWMFPRVPFSLREDAHGTPCAAPRGPPRPQTHRHATRTPGLRGPVRGLTELRSEHGNGHLT